MYRNQKPSRHSRKVWIQYRLDKACAACSHSSLATLSHRRSADEINTEKSLDNSGLAILIKIALACFDWFVANDSDQAEACVVSWWNADCLTLKRTAIWGLGVLPSWSPDRKVTWLVEKLVFRNPAYEREFLRVLDGSLQSSSDGLKTSVIEEIKEHYPKRYQPEMRDYVLHQIFMKLREYDPSFGRLQDEILALEQRRPELSPRPVESVDTKETEIQAEEATFTEKELVELSPDRAAVRLLNMLDEIGESKRRTLLRIVSEALRLNSDWGIGLANELVGRNVWQPDLWSTVVGGLNTGSLAVLQWESVLTLLADHPRIYSLASYQIVALLEQGIRSESYGVSDPQLVLAMRVTLYHSPLRPATLKFVERHAARIGSVFSQVSARRPKTNANMRRAVKEIADLGFIHSFGPWGARSRLSMG